MTVIFRSSILLFLLGCLFGLQVLCCADETYTVNGKSVSKGVYDGAVLLQEANDLIKVGNLDRAAGKLRRSLLCAPNLYQAHTNLGIILARQGKNAEALAHFKESIKSDDFEPTAYLNLVSFYQATGNLDGAIETYKKYMEKSSSSDTTPTILTMLEKEREKERVGEQKTASKDYIVNESSMPLAHWSEFRMPLRVYIEKPGELDGFQDHDVDLLKQAFEDWHEATNGKLSFLFVPSAADCDISCSWTNDAEQLANGTEAGNTSTMIRGGALNRAEILLRAKQQEGCFPFTENSVISTYRHEVGHSLGVIWHSPDPNDLMYFALPLADREQIITSRDKNTMLRLYAMPIPWSGLVADFVTNPTNTKTLAPMLIVLLMVLGFLALLARLLFKRKKSKKQKIIS